MILVIRKLFRNSKFIGITLYPFIILKSKKDRQNAILINHEKIHLKQQLELLVFPFYLWYSVEYLIRLYQLRDRHAAYRAISFEREAYSNETDMDYIKNRKYYSFLRYLKSEK